MRRGASGGIGLAAGEPLPIHGDGRQTRDFTHVSDVVRASLAAMDCAIADGRALNVGAGRNLRVEQVAAIVGGPRTDLPERPGDVRHTLADLSQTKTVLGWRPEIAAEDGIRDLMRLFGLKPG